MTTEQADALRDAADVMDELSRDPSVSNPLELTHRAVTAADLRRYADKLEKAS
jgi:hypothetical protein